MAEENLFTPRCIRTHSGIYMNVFEPTLEMIDINDIAHALSHQCRFGGHLDTHYSVAQHSFHCAELVSEEHKLSALLHDASEAYLVDIPSPIKKELPNYKVLEDNLMKVIAEKFGFQFPLSKEVHEADVKMLHFEWDAFMLGEKPKKETVPLSQYIACEPERMYCEGYKHYKSSLAKKIFLRMFEYLTIK